MNTAKHYKELGNVAFRMGNYQEAVNQYTEAIRLYEDGVFFLNRAQAFQCMEKSQEAQDDLLFYFAKRIPSNLKLSCKALYRLATALRSLESSSLYSADAISFLYSASLQEESNSMVRNSFYSWKQQILKERTTLLHSTNLFSNHMNSISRFTTPIKKNIMWDDIKTSFISSTSSYIEIEAIGSNLCFVGFGNDLFSVLDTVTRTKLNCIESLHLIDTSRNRLVRGIVIMWILEHFSYSWLDREFLLCIYYDSFLSTEHLSTLSKVLDEIVATMERKEQFFTLGSSLLHSDPTNIQSLMRIFFILYRSIMSEEMALYAKDKRTRDFSKKHPGNNAAAHWHATGNIYGDEANFVNPLMFDPVSLECLDRCGPFCQSNQSLSLPCFRKELETSWNSIFEIVEENTTIFSQLEKHYWCGEALSVLQENVYGMGVHFHWIETFSLVDVCGLWNLLPVCVPLLANAQSVLQMTTQYGPPSSYQRMIAPMYCNESDVDSLLETIGTIAATKMATDEKLCIHCKKIIGKDQKPTEARTRKTIEHLTRLLMRYSMSPIQPYDDGNSQQLFEGGFQYPVHTMFSLLLCARIASSLYPSSIKHLVDVVLLSAQLADRPFIRHRKLSLRILASLVKDHIPDSFMSPDLYIPRKNMVWKCAKIIPNSAEFKEVSQKKNLVLLLFPTLSLAKEAVQAQENREKTELFLWIMGKDEKHVQILDYVDYCPLSKTVSYLWPVCDFMADELKFGALIDLNNYRALSNPIALL